MDKRNFGKILGIAGMAIIIKGQAEIISNFYQIAEPVQMATYISTDERPNLAVQAFDFTGIPQARFSNVISSSVAGIAVSFVPTIIDVDSLS